jgi:hypothetical protein
MDIVPRPPGVKVLDSLTRNEYKTVDDTLQRRKTRWCIRGDQQEYHVEDRRAPVLKAPEARLIAAIAAHHKCDLYSTDTKQAPLYGDMLEDEEVYVKSRDWWVDSIREGHVFKLKKAIYGTKQAARLWHTKISTWMEYNRYPAVNCEKTILMKRAEDSFIIHGLFVDDIMTTPTKRALMDEFIEIFSKDFEITGGRLMEKFIGLSVEQDASCIAVHLDQYIKDAIEQHESFVKKSLRPKFTLMQPGNTLSDSDSPITPDPRLQTHYRSMVATLQFAADSFLCICRTDSPCCSSPSRGISGPLPKLQAGKQQEELQPHGSRWLLRLGLGNERLASFDNRLHLPLQWRSHSVEDEIAEVSILVHG